MQAPHYMGILNITPDSFSDGGKFTSLDAAFKHAEQLINEGATSLDVGGESTRPNAASVPENVEMGRVVPVIEGLKKRFSVPLSVDTYKYAVAVEAVKAGASILNDISGGEDTRFFKLAFEKDLHLVLMHMKGTPRTMQKNPEYARGVVNEVRSFLEERTASAEQFGVKKEKIWVDPGIGFGKTLSHNLELLKNIAVFNSVAGGVLIGTSRKSFLAAILEKPDLPMEMRESGTIASCLYAYQRGVSIFRVHDVGGLKRALQTWQAIEEENSR